MLFQRNGPQDSDNFMGRVEVELGDSDFALPYRAEGVALRGRGVEREPVGGWGWGVYVQ